jgi:hypothetical protein
LEPARVDVAATVRRLARIIKGDRSDGWLDRLPKVLKEHRLQCGTLAQLSAATAAVEREIRDAPMPDAPDGFEEFERTPV